MCLEVSVSSIERSTIFSQPPQHSTGGLPVVTTLQLGFCGVLLVKYQPALCVYQRGVIIRALWGGLVWIVWASEWADIPATSQLMGLQRTGLWFVQ